MKSLLLAVVFLVSLISGTANANVTYVWVTTSLTGPIAENPELFTPSKFIVTDDAFALGSMSFIYGQCPTHQPPCGIDVGDHSGFVPTGGSGFFGQWEWEDLGIFQVNVTFNSDGSLTGLINQGGVTTDWRFEGTGYNWTAYFASDAFRCSQSDPCHLRGYWQIPEPATVALFGLALASLGWYRHRNRRRRV